MSRVTSLAIAILTAAAIAAAQQPASIVKDGYYVLQSGDELSIRVFQQPQLDETVRIRPDGRVSVMLLDDLVVAGLTTRDLNAQLTAQYAKLFREPQVTVIVRQFANLKIFVGGEVAQPGTIPLAGQLTAVGAILQAGGFKTTAKTDSVILVRNDGGKPVASRIDAGKILTKGGVDATLQPFDIVYVPRSRIAAADRFVDQYIRQLIPASLNAGFTYILGDRVVLR